MWTSPVGFSPLAKLNLLDLFSATRRRFVWRFVDVDVSGQIRPSEGIFTAAGFGISEVESAGGLVGLELELKCRRFFQRRFLQRRFFQLESFLGIALVDLGFGLPFLDRLLTSKQVFWAIPDIFLFVVVFLDWKEFLQDFLFLDHCTVHLMLVLLQFHVEALLDFIDMVFQCFELLFQVTDVVSHKTEHVLRKVDVLFTCCTFLFLCCNLVLGEITKEAFKTTSFCLSGVSVAITSHSDCLRLGVVDRSFTRDSLAVLVDGIVGRNFIVLGTEILMDNLVRECLLVDIIGFQD
mmetsp:Transcript_42225/g.101618  ORF Transcript_42225/g.101618 Transcript_42225/m.101618 type:complete len:293 (-) Transcript_42225:1608-2486(-)